jgi:hypothetical protein
LRSVGREYDFLFGMGLIRDEKLIWGDDDLFFDF